MDMAMTLDRLREIVEAYGAAAHRWPLAEREAALALVAANDKARALIDEALTLDLMLDAAPAVEPASDELVSRIMAARPRAVPAVMVDWPVSNGPLGFLKARLQEIWPYGPPAIPAGALAASIMLGVGFGFSVPTAATALGNLSLTSQTAGTITTSDLSDQLVVLAFAENQYPQEWQQ